MPRLLTDEALASIGRQHSVSHNLIYLDLPSNELFLAIDTHQDALLFQRTAGPIQDTEEQVWVGVGGGIFPGSADESPEIDGQGQDIQMIALDPSFELGTMLLNARPFNRTYQHWRVQYHDVGSLAGTVRSSYLVFHGKLNGRFEVESVTPEDWPGAEPGTIRVRFRAMNPLALLDVARSIKTNLTSHQKHYPADLFMTHVQDTMNRRIFVGTEAPSEGSE